MVKKKVKSKRVKAAMRYKIEKRVREHHRKARKEAKKNPQKKRSPKDLGIPNSCPFKQEMLEEIEREREEAERQKQELRAARIESRKQQKLRDTEEAAL